MAAGAESALRFGDTLAACVSRRESQIVLGLDPDPQALWPGVVEGEPGWPHAPSLPLPVLAVLAHCRALIEAVGPACVAVKLQLACFERLGRSGPSVLEALSSHARAHGLLVIADGKRGDIDVSARAYAEALFDGVQTPFGAVAGLGADAITVNPLMGRDALAPFVLAARRRGGGVLALVRTSNPGAADIQDLELAGGGRVWERLAAIVAEFGCAGVGNSGLSDVGAVIGATASAELATARALMPHAPFLLPGVGVQGGRVQDLQSAFAPGPAGGLVSASRSIANAYKRSGGEPAGAARAEAERLREAAWELAARASR